MCAKRVCSLRNSGSPLDAAPKRDAAAPNSGRRGQTVEFGEDLIAERPWASPIVEYAAVSAVLAAYDEDAGSKQGLEMAGEPSDETGIVGASRKMEAPDCE
jgi:hypothetical protein